MHQAWSIGLPTDTDFCTIDSMKTTLNLSDQLLSRAKALAAKERITLTRMIEEGLALRLRRKLPRAVGTLKPLPVSRRTGGFVRGIDGTSNQSMLDAADA